jgi:hypothetical protein
MINKSMESNLLYIFEGVELYPLSALDKKFDLVEYAFDDLLDDTDDKRLLKAKKHVRKFPPRVIGTDSEGYEVLEFNFKSFPSVSGKRAKGYIIHKDRDIKEMYCSCHDFFYRLWYKLVDNGLARFDVPRKYPRIMPPNKMKMATGDIRKEGEELFLCKHLAAMGDYL